MSLLLTVMVRLAVIPSVIARSAGTCANILKSGITRAVSSSVARSSFPLARAAIRNSILT